MRAIDDGGDVPSTSAEAIRSWLLEVLRVVNLKPTPFAKQAGLSASTIFRALDPNSGSTLEIRTINKIVQKYGVRPPGNVVEAPKIQGLSEPELQILSTPLDAGVELTPTQGQWVIRTRALELLGYLPGDIATADSAETPRAHDVVVAQIVDAQSDTAETVIRLYDPPYLLTETADPEARRKPALVDFNKISIWGVVVRSERRRRP